MKKLKGFVLLMFCCLFSGVIALSACSPSDDTSSTSSSVDSSSTIDSSASDSSSSSSSDASSSTGDSSSVDDSSSSDSSSTESDETNYDPMLESITVDASGAKTSYALGEEFSSDGIVVKAQTTINLNPQDSITLAATDYTVDSSNFDNSKVGTYTIYVTYALPANPQAFQNAEYTVTVSSSLPTYANIKVEYSGDTQYTYSGTDITIDLSSDKISATSYVGDDSTNLTATTVTDYDLYYSINSGALTKVEGTSITASRRGTYSFYVVKDYVSGTESIEMSGQFIVYVVDAPVSFAYNSDGTTSYGEDVEESDIGTDWTYTLTLASGATETLGYADVTLEPGTSPGSNTVTVTYVDEYSYIVEGVVTSVTNTYTASVTYTVAGEIIATNVVLNISDLVTDGTLSNATYSAETTLFNDNATTISVTASESSTVSVDGNSKSIDGYSFTNRLKLGGAGSADARSVKITTAGACTITVYMMSSSGSDSRTVGLYQNITSTDVDGNETATFTLVDTAQTVGGSAIAKYTYTVSAAGTYYLAAASGGTNIYGILVTY